MNITQILKTTKRIFGFSRVLPALAGLALLIPSTAQAANGTWSTLSSGNASGSWGTQGNWSGLTLPTTSGDTANFGTLNITSDSTVTLDGNQSVNALIFGDSAISTAANWILSSGAPGTYTLTLGGTTPSITVNPLGSTKTATISAIVNGTTGLIKAGSGPLTLSNANTYTGTTTLNSGTLRITGSLNGTTGTPLTFSGSGTFNSSEASGISQSMGALTLSAGDGTVQSTFGSGSAIALTFDSLATRVKGASANFVVSGGVNGTDNKIAFTTAPTAGQLIDRGFFFGGSSYAAYDAGGYMRGLVYGTDANTAGSLFGTLATLSINDATKDVQFAGSANATNTSGTALSNVKTLNVTDGTKFCVGQAITGSGIPANTWITAIAGQQLSLSQAATVPTGTILTPYSSVTNQSTASINTLNLSGVGASLTLAASQTLSVNGILRSGNNSGVVGAISGGTAIQPATSGGELVIRTDAVNDTLNISSIIQNNASASSLTKTGAGTLILEDLASNANNTYSGGTFINAGTVQLGAGNAGSGSRTWFGPAGSLVTMADGAAITSVNDPAKTIANTIYLSSGFPSVTTRDIILNGTISGPGGLAIISFNGRGVTLPVANSFTGGVKLQAGGGSGGEVRLSTTASAGAFGTGTLRVESANGPVLMGNATLNGGSGVPNPIDLAPGATFTVTPSGASFPVLLSGTISGLGALSKSGVGSLTLSGANTYSGGTTVSYGLLTVSGSGTFGSSAGNLTASGGILDLNAASWNAGLVTISGGTIQNGTLTATTSPYTASKGFVFANLAGGSIGLTMNGSGNRLVLSGNNTYGGTTTITAGTLQPTSAVALPNYASGTVYVNASGTLLISSEGWAQSEISALLNNANLTFATGGILAIDTTGGGFADSTILDPANMGLTKMGANTLTLSGTSTYSGKTTVTAGTIMLDAGAGGALSSSSALTFGGTGTFNYDNTTSLGSKAQIMGTLTFSIGEGTLRLTRTASQPVSLTFSSLGGRGAGATRNFVIDGTPGLNGTDSKIILTGQTAGFIDQATFFGGNAYAWMNGASPSYVRGMNYESDAGTVTSGAATTLASATHQQITGAISAQNTATFTTLNISGNNNLTLAAAQTVSVNGILKTGNVAGGTTISGGTGIQAVSSGGDMVIRTDGTNDVVTISTPILANGASLLTKSGAGTLTLSGNNTITGGVNLNAGQLNINSPNALGTIASRLTINAGTTLNNTSGGDISVPNKNPITVNGSFTYVGTSGSLSFPDDFQNGLTINSGVGDIAINVVTNTLKIPSSVNGGTTARIVKNGGGTLWLGNNGGFGSTGGFIVNAGVLTGNKNQPDSFCGTGPITLGATSGSDNAIINCGVGGIVHGNAIAVRAGSTGIMALTSTSGTSSWGGAVTLNNNLTLSGTSGNGSLNFAGEFAGLGGIIIGNTGSFKIATTTYQLANGGTVGLYGNSTYTGNTVLNSGTLQLGPAAAPNASPLISIAAGATLDTTLISAFTLGSGTTLEGKGTGTTAGTTAARIQGASGTSVNLGSRPINLTFTPTSGSGDTTHPSLLVSQGNLALSGNTISVVNNGPTLGAGVYRLIQVTSATTTGAPNTAPVVVTGTGGLAPYSTALATVSSGNVILTVTTKAATSFSGLPVSQTIQEGTANVPLSGTVSASGPTYPANGENVRIVINGVTNSTPVNAVGQFSTSFATAALTTGGSPYTIAYFYDGNSTLWTASDTNTLLTVSSITVPTIVAWPTAGAITYGDALNVSSLIGGSATNAAGADVPGVFTFTTGSTIPSVAGTYLASGTFTPNSGSYSTIVTPDAITVAVGTKALTIGSPDVTPKTYTGTAGAVITGTLNGVVAGDGPTEINLVGTGTFTTLNVANGISVTAACTLTGTKASSYTLTQPTGLSGNITKATLTVRADNKNRLPGTANPSLTYTVSGYQNGENDVAVGLTGVPSLSTDAVLESSEGEYTITIVPNTLVLTSGNYALDFVNGTLKVRGVVTWTKGIGAWDIETSVNWTNAVFGAVTYVDGGEVLFNDLPAGFGPFAVTLNTTVNPASVAVSNAVNKDYVISGSGKIGGAAALTKAGAGSLTLGNANTFSGGVTASGGTLVIANQNALGYGTLTLAGGTTLKQDGFEGNGPAGAITNAINLSGGNVSVPLSFGGAKDIWLTGSIAGTGGLTVSGDARSLTLYGNSSFSGGVVFQSSGCGLTIAHTNALGTGVLRAATTTLGTGLLGIAADLSVGNGVTNPIDLAPGSYLNVNVSYPLKLSGAITNSGSLYKSGTATLTLSGANSYTGTTTVAQGELTLTQKHALGQTALFVEANTKVNLNYSGVMYIRALTINGAVQPIGEYGAFNFSQYFTGGGRLSTDKPIIGTMIIIQ